MQHKHERSKIEKKTGTQSLKRSKNKTQRVSLEIRFTSLVPLKVNTTAINGRNGRLKFQFVNFTRFVFAAEIISKRFHERFKDEICDEKWHDRLAEICKYFLNAELKKILDLRNQIAKAECAVWNEGKSDRQSSLWRTIKVVRGEIQGSFCSKPEKKKRENTARVKRRWKFRPEKLSKHYFLWPKCDWPFPLPSGPPHLENCAVLLISCKIK